MPKIKNISTLPSGFKHLPYDMSWITLSDRDTCSTANTIVHFFTLLLSVSSFPLSPLSKTNSKHMFDKLSNSALLVLRPYNGCKIISQLILSQNLIMNKIRNYIATIS